MISLSEFVRTVPFFVIAHRGSSGDAPENTLSAIRLAIEGGAKMVEIDVQSTLDNEIVVLHDDVLGRTTDGRGLITELDSAKVRDLDAGSWFDVRFAGEKVPLLDEALDLICENVYLNLEIKPLSNNGSSFDVIRRIIKKIKERSYERHTVFASFDHRALTLIQEMDPELHTAALNKAHDNRLPSEILKSCHANAFGCSLHELSNARAEDCKYHSIPFGVYTVNSRDALQKALSFGVMAVVSNYPARINQEYENLIGQR
ncbi:MAG: hypothetical protein HYX66_07020 [Ignavibacteria bacterium]|nr:hypothetical protein [Ignavibacteria bacterium]